MRENISVRQWQAMYRLGAFSGKDTVTQCEAGWYDWFCRDDSLAGRLKQIAPAVMGITDPFILDHYCVRFVNEGKWRKAIYDSVRFEPLDGGPDDVKFFKVDFRSPEEPDKWTLYSGIGGLVVVLFPSLPIEVQPAQSVAPGQHTIVRRYQQLGVPGIGKVGWFEPSQRLFTSPLDAVSGLHYLHSPPPKRPNTIRFFAIRCGQKIAVPVVAQYWDMLAPFLVDHLTNRPLWQVGELHQIGEVQPVVCTVR